MDINKHVIIECKKYLKNRTTWLPDVMDVALNEKCWYKLILFVTKAKLDIQVIALKTLIKCLCELIKKKKSIDRT